MANISMLGNVKEATMDFFHHKHDENSPPRRRSSVWSSASNSPPRANYFLEDLKNMFTSKKSPNTK